MGKQMDDDTINRLIALFQGTGDDIVYWNEVKTGATLIIEFSGPSARYLESV